MANAYNGRGAHGAIRHMVGGSGLSSREVSRDMGRSPRYLINLYKQGNNPSASIMAEISKACGYDMRLVGHGQTIHIRPND